METNNRILIVDDNKAIHQDFQKILGTRKSKTNDENFSEMEAILFAEADRSLPCLDEMDYHFDFALQAQPALDMIEKAEEEVRPYAIMFTDIRMPPGFDGVQLVEKVLRRAPFTEVVIITAFSDYSWDDLHLKFGWTDRILILRKPFDTITVKQIASTLTKKWELGYQTRKLTKEMSLHLLDLERKVEDRTAEVRAAYQELQDFAYIVSHDLRSPLVGIQGFAKEIGYDLEELFALIAPLVDQMDEVHQSKLAKIRDHNVPEALDVISSSVVKMNNLIKALLNLARLEHREFRIEEVGCNELVESLLKTLAFHIEQSEAVVKVNPLPTVRTDLLAMEQIFSNLITNAVKYLQPGRPGEISVSAEQRTEHCVFHITDNGRGIAKDAQERIFRIFQRVGHKDVDGDGMGLTYVKALVKRLGGSIWCDSELDKGSTFSFLLPIKPPAGL